MCSKITNRERLLIAAKELFLEQGYDASVEAIISRADVARQTFYNHFKNKESLFAEAIRDCFVEITAPLNGPPEQCAIVLKHFAQIYRQRALSPEGIASYRTLSGQTMRFPDLVHEIYMLSTGQMIDKLATFLGNAMHAGQLSIADQVFAAELFMAMLLGQERSQLLFGIQRPQQDENLIIANVVAGFMRMYAPIDNPY